MCVLLCLWSLHRFSLLVSLLCCIVDVFNSVFNVVCALLALQRDPLRCSMVAVDIGDIGEAFVAVDIGDVVEAFLLAVVGIIADCCLNSAFNLS